MLSQGKTSILQQNCHVFLYRAGWSDSHQHPAGSMVSQLKKKHLRQNIIFFRQKKKERRTQSVKMMHALTASDA